MKYIFFLIFTLYAFAAFSQNSRKKMLGKEEALEKRIESLEESLLDIRLRHSSESPLQISGDFRTIFQSVNRNDSVEGEERLTHPISELRLHFDQTERDKIKFHGTLGAAYFWNKDFQMPSIVRDNQTRQINGNNPMVHKAFVDFFVLDKKASFSFGRLPTQYGPPDHLNANTTRQGTYPLLIYSLPLDGVAFTVNIGRIFESEKRHIFRLIYSPFFYTDNPNDPTAVGGHARFADLKTSAGEGFNLNYETSGRSGLGNYNFILHGYASRLGRSQSLKNVRGLLQSQLPEGHTDNNVYEIGSDDKSIGSLSSTVAYFEIKDLVQTGFDIYGAYKYSKYQSTGNFDAVIVEDNMGSVLGAAGDSFDLGGYIYDNDEEGGSILMGGRYNFSSQCNLGLEYLRQTFGNAPTALSTFSFTDFYQTIGYGYHAYSNFELEDGFNLGVGYFYSNVEADFKGFSYAGVRRNVNTAYMSARYSF